MRSPENGGFIRVSEQTETMKPASVVAHKFGGSSLADAERISTRRKSDSRTRRKRRKSCRFRDAESHRRTIGLADAASSRRDWRDDWSALRDRHLATADALLADATTARGWLDQQFDELAERLHAISVLGSSTRDIGDAISGLGEVWSAYLVHAHLLGRDGRLRIARRARRAHRPPRRTRCRRRLGQRPKRR